MSEDGEAGIGKVEPAGAGRELLKVPAVWQEHLLGSADVEWPLRDRPGFLLRRAHQIHVALFSSYCGEFDITPVQYSLLAALAALGQADQSGLAAAIGMDRSTTAGALKRLEARGLLERQTLPTDRRAQFCVITAAGTALLGEIEEPARLVHAATIAALTPAEQYLLIQLLQKVVEQAPAEDAAAD